MSTDVRFNVVDHLVVQTYVVHRGRGALSHYEIQLAVDPKGPRVVLLTNDEAIYEAALAAEGTDARIDAAWRPCKRRGGQVAQLLCAIRRHQEAA